MSVEYNLESAYDLEHDIPCLIQCEIFIRQRTTTSVVELPETNVRQSYNGHNQILSIKCPLIFSNDM